MCRFLAYAAKSDVAAIELAPETFSEFIALSRKNADGWGMAWYGEGQVPSVSRSLESAGTDPRFIEEASRPLGEIGIVHLRSATPPLAVNFNNSHPFIHGQYAMAHNGAISPPTGQTAMDLEAVEHIVPEDWRGQLRGNTDSERFFMAVVAKIAAGASAVCALRDTAAKIVDDFLPTCLNAFLIGPDALYAICWFQDEPYPAEYYKLFEPDELKDYFHLRYKRTDNSFVIASTGWPQSGCTELGRNRLIKVERHTLKTTEFDLFPAT